MSCKFEPTLLFNRVSRIYGKLNESEPRISGCPSCQWRHSSIRLQQQQFALAAFAVGRRLHEPMGNVIELFRVA